MSKVKKASPQYFITDQCDGFIVYEKNADGYLRRWHDQTISEDAAKCLHNDLVLHGGAPFFAGPSYVEPSFIAECYDIAVRTLPMIGEDEKAWNIALTIAAEKPWMQPYFGSDMDPIPF